METVGPFEGGGEKGGGGVRDGKRMREGRGGNGNDAGRSEAFRV